MIVIIGKVHLGWQYTTSIEGQLYPYTGYQI